MCTWSQKHVSCHQELFIPLTFGTHCLITPEILMQAILAISGIDPISVARVGWPPGGTILIRKDSSSFLSILPWAFVKRISWVTPHWHCNGTWAHQFCKTAINFISIQHTLSLMLTFRQLSVSLIPDRNSFHQRLRALPTAYFPSLMLPELILCMLF